MALRRLKICALYFKPLLVLHNNHVTSHPGEKKNVHPVYCTLLVPFSKKVNLYVELILYGEQRHDAAQYHLQHDQAERAEEKVRKG